MSPMAEYILLNGVRKEVIRGFLEDQGAVGTDPTGAVNIFIETTPQNIAATINKLLDEAGNIEFKILGYSNGMVLLHVFWSQPKDEEEETTPEKIEPEFQENEEVKISEGIEEEVPT